MISRIKQLTLVCGDIIALYAALFAMLAIRYGVFSQEYVGAHLAPFTAIFAFWIVVFYIAGLYDLTVKRTHFELAKALGVSVGVGTLIAIVIFYTVPYFNISPKRSLVMFAVVYFFFAMGWRTAFSSVIPAYKKNIVIVGTNRETEELYAYFKNNPFFGYTVIGYLNQTPLLAVSELKNTLSKYNASLIVMAKNAQIPKHVREEIYRFAARGTDIVESSALYEYVFKKMSLEFHEDLITLGTRGGGKKMYDSIKIPAESLLAVLLFIILSPLFLLVYVLVKITSTGPGIYKQVRCGALQKEFYIYKFRTMVRDAEKMGAQWSQEGDPRVTRFGRVLRYTHIDELPQLINVARRDISFVGPRPERPEFVKTLLEKIPHYELRHMVKPGITGWAQINYKYGSSIEDARVKLQYDLYYVKHRSFFLDTLIVLKTIKHFFAKDS